MMKRNDNIIAYILINLDIEASTQEIAKKLRNIPEVTEAYSVYGTYDVMLKIETTESSKVKDVTIKSLRKLEGVQKTITMISVESWDRI